MDINFYSEDVSFLLNDQESTTSWIRTIIKHEFEIPVKVINYIFCADDYLLAMNKQYLKHNTLTDIITFDNTEPGEAVEADIFISIDRVKENALTLNKDFAEELHRVIIHGLLHLRGYNDKTAVEKAEMRKKEDACLSLR